MTDRIRLSGKPDKTRLSGDSILPSDDELLEVTPKSLRIRKQILNHEQRMKARSRNK